jgi:hypothetical protein
MRLYSNKQWREAMIDRFAPLFTGFNRVANSPLSEEVEGGGFYLQNKAKS